MQHLHENKIQQEEYVRRFKEEGLNLQAQIQGGIKALQEQNEANNAREASQRGVIHQLEQDKAQAQQEIKTL